MNQTLLLAGATGMLGSQIARELLEQRDAQVRLLVRDARDARKRSVLEPLLAQGAEIVEGDLADASSLDRATQGIDVIVSAVQGGPEVVVSGQVALAEAGKRNGVRRMLPSDFALDLFKATPGEHAMFDMRRHAAEGIGATGLEVVHVLQGGFMEMFTPGMGMFDSAAGVVSFWGDGSEMFEVTSVADTARMTARIALDRSVGSGKFAFAGDRISFRSAADSIEQQTGRHFEPRSLGSEADLRAAMAVAAKDRANPFQAVMLAYQLYMLNGQTALTDLQNDRYPDVALETLRAFSARTLSS
jgi:uncharacterized protein YbjT (DUF2867 family)